MEVKGQERLLVRDEILIRHFRKGLLIEADSSFIDLVVNKGLEMLAKLANGVSPTPFKYTAIGTGTTAPANGDTALQAEITSGGGERGLATCSYEADYKAKWVKTFNFTASFAVTEAGLFDDPSAGNMVMRHVFTAKNVENGDSLEVTHKLTFARV